MTEFIILMASMMSLVALSIDAMLPALGIMGQDLGVTHANQQQYIIGFIFIGMTFGQLLAGPLSDSIGRKKTLYISFAVYLLGTVICYFSPDIQIMLLGRLIQGIGVSGPRIAAVAIVRDKYAGRDMAKIMSLVMMIFILVPAIAPSVGQAILLTWSWRYIFLLYIVMTAALFLWILVRLEETLKPEDKIRFSVDDIVRGFKLVLQNRVALVYTLCMGICFGSLIGYLNSSQQIFQDHFKVGKMFTVYFGILALTIGIASLVNSRIVQKYGMRYICQRSTLAIILASLIFIGINLAMPVTLWMFMIYAAILFFNFGLMFGNLNSIAMEPMGHIAGIASSVIGSISTAISVAVGATIGQLYNDTLIPVVTGFLMLNILSLLAMVYEQKTEKPQL